MCGRAKHAVALLALIFGIGNDGIRADDAALIYLVRHAEKQPVSDDPGLTAAGRRRAVELAHLLQNAGIEAVYSTDFARTRDTAAPLAEQLDIPIRIYDPEQMEMLAAEMVRNGGCYLVVGHSDTTPELVGMLGGEPGPPIDEPTEYDRLYVVRVAADGGVNTELRHYGQPRVPRGP